MPTQKVTKNASGMELEKNTYTYTVDDSISYDYTIGVSPNIGSIAVFNTDTKITTAGDSHHTPPDVQISTDQLGQMITEKYTQPGGTTVLNLNKYTYDYIGNVTEYKGGRGYAEDWAYSAKTEYNFAGQPIKQIDPSGKFITATYDRLGRMITSTDYENNTTEFTYDEAGRLIKTIMPFEGSYTTETLNYYDKSNNLVKTKTQNNKPGESKTYSTVEYEYDELNRLVTVKNDDGVAAVYTQYAYDVLSNMTKMFIGQTSKVNTSGTDPGDGRLELYEYDRFGNITKVTDALNQTATASYDLRGLPINQTDRNGTVTSTVYNAFGSPMTLTATGSAGTKVVSYNYNKNNKILSIAERNGSASEPIESQISYVYDDFGRLKTETEGNVVKSYTYDNDDNRKTFELKVNASSKMQVSYTYDNRNLLTSVTDDNNVTAYTYNDNGTLSIKANDDGYSSNYEYNKAGQITSLQNKRNSNIISSFGYAYYLDGNQSTKTEGSSITSYTYDGMGRLNTETTPSFTTTYSYDNMSNRSKMTRTGAGAAITDYIYDGNNRLKTETKVFGDTTYNTYYDYDNNGNIYSKIKEELAPTSNLSSEATLFEGSNPFASLYEYDVLGRMTRANANGIAAEYAYSANGMRKSKTLNGDKTTHIWDGMNIVAESNSAGTVYAKYYRGRGGEINSTEYDGVIDYYFYNGHGDVVQKTDNYTSRHILKIFVGAVPQDLRYDLNNDGVVNAADSALYLNIHPYVNYGYDAFGNESEVTNDLAVDMNPFRYCGEYTDLSSGLIYLRNRYYDPSVGRFITEDPIQAGLNWYTYCHNDPINFFDPLGTEESRDKDILTSEDYQKVLIYTAIYNWAIDNGDNVTADYMRHLAVQIRQDSKYNGTGYGQPGHGNITPKLGEAVIQKTTGYSDNYIYTSNPKTGNVSILISDPISVHDVGWHDGSDLEMMFNSDDSPPTTIQEWVTGEILGAVAGKISQSNPLYGKVKAGDRYAEVKRYYVTTSIWKWTKKFYFHMNENSVDNYYIK